MTVVTTRIIVAPDGTIFGWVPVRCHRPRNLSP